MAILAGLQHDEPLGGVFAFQSFVFDFIDEDLANYGTPVYLFTGDDNKHFDHDKCAVT